MSVAVSGCTATPEDDHRPETQLLSRYRPASHRSRSSALVAVAISEARAAGGGAGSRMQGSSVHVSCAGVWASIVISLLSQPPA